MTAALALPHDEDVGKTRCVYEALGYHTGHPSQGAAGESESISPPKAQPPGNAQANERRAYVMLELSEALSATQG